MPFRPPGVRRAHQVDLHLAAALDSPIFSPVLTTSRVNNVVAISSLPENSDAYVLEQAGVLAFELDGLRGRHLKHGLFLVDLFEVESRGLP